MPQLLRYHELNPGKLADQVEQTAQYLAEGNFRAADVKKMTGTDGLYRAKLDRSNRLLFKFARYQGETYLLLLEVIPEHDYASSKFLRGAAVDERKFQPVSQPEPPEPEVTSLLYANPQRPTFHLLDKVISFDEEQHAILALRPPLIIIGSAGSGKTALTLEKMKEFRGSVAYVSLSSFLVENAQRIYYSHGYENEQQEVDFVSFREYLEGIQVPEGREATQRDFEGWYQRYRQQYKFKDAHKLFEEFKGVLTGSVTEAAYLSREDYLNLGVKQSIFLKEERKAVYDLFERYLQFLKEQQLYDANMVAFDYLERVQPRYDFVVVDEVQDITNVQLMLILRSLSKPHNFILSGDSNQIVHPNFFSWSKIKSLFFEAKLQGSAIRILKTNYRNSQRITRLSNDLLKVKNARFGSIDKESTYLIDTVSKHEGDITFFKDSEKIRKELNQKTQNSAKYAVLVMEKEQKAKVREQFKTPLVFSVQEAKGLEYENIILVNFVSDHEKEFREITKGVSAEALKDENFQFGRAKNKEDKDLDAYKFYINSLYVAFTRAVKNIFILETKPKQDLLRLLQVSETQEQVKMQQEASTDAEWLEEARRLEKQGKFEQAQEIRDRIRGVTYLSPEQLEALKRSVFQANVADQAQCKQLFEYAKSHQQLDLIDRLYRKARYGPAKQFMQAYQQDQRSLEKYIKNGNLNKVKKLVESYGLDMREPQRQRTGLMLAVLYGKENLVNYYLEAEASILTPDANQQIALHHALLGFELEHFDEKKLARFYPQLRPDAIKVETEGQRRKLHARSMEYFLVNYLVAVRSEVVDPSDPPAMQGLTMDDFMDYLELMPDSILAPYRRKRQYVNSILAKNEIDRDDKYNRRLFKRKSRGVYDLLPGLTLRFDA